MREIPYDSVSSVISSSIFDSMFRWTASLLKPSADDDCL